VPCLCRSNLVSFMEPVLLVFRTVVLAQRKYGGPCYLNEPLWGPPGVGVGCKTEVRSGCNGERNGNMVAVRSGGVNWIGVGCGDDIWLPQWGISYS